MSQRGERLVRSAIMILALLAVAAMVSPPAQAQSSEQPVPKVEIFAGYAWMEPGGSVAGVKLKSMPKGFGSSVTINVDKWWGLELDTGGDWDSTAHVGTIMAGPRFKWRNEHISPFLHALVGLHLLAPSGSPRVSAATMVITVRVPVPRSWLQSSTSTVPSG